jgi:hypothetical protein
MRYTSYDQLNKLSDSEMLKLFAHTMAEMHEKLPVTEACTAATVFMRQHTIIGLNNLQRMILERMNGPK